MQSVLLFIDFDNLVFTICGWIVLFLYHFQQLYVLKASDGDNIK